MGLYDFSPLLFFAFEEPVEYQVDDESLVQLLKGLCLKHLGRYLQAELCLNQVIQK